jgi:HAD superfamily hydrolase (TIGR01484 family)
MFKMVVFDLDGTLAPSKWQMDQEMVDLFKKLLSKYKVWVISGGDFPQFQKQVLPFLWDNENILKNLYICPTCSTKMYIFESWKWVKKYSLDFSDKERNYILKILNQAIDELNLRPEKTWWELVEDRWTQITYSALWQQAPLEAKQIWDKDGEKRKQIRNYLLPYLKDYNILIGWTTSIDITRNWVDKAYWVRKLSEISGIDKNEIIFVWDAIFPWWNDFPPLEIGVTSKKVESVEETKRYIEMLIN